MALNKQQVPLNFAGGIDTKTDDKQVLPSKLLQLENGVLTKKGAINKRYGYDILDKKIIDTESDISQAYGISSYKDELILFDSENLYTYIESKESWKSKGNAVSAVLQNKQIVRNVYQQSNPDYGYNSGLGCYVWDDSNGGCRYSVIDELNGAILVDNASLSSTGKTARVCGIGKYFFITYIEGTTIKFKTIQLSTPTLLSSSLDLTTQVDPANKIYDVLNTTDRVYIAYNTNDPSGSVGIFYLTATKVVSTTRELLADNADSAMSLAIDSNQNIWLAYHNGTDLKYAIWNYNLDVTIGDDPTILVPTTIDTVASVRNITGVMTDTDEVTWLFEIEQDLSGVPANYVMKVVTDIVGTSSSPIDFVRSSGLTSKIFTYNSVNYVSVAHESDLQSTYFIYDLDANLVSKINQGNGGGYTENSILPSAVSIDSGKFIIPSQKKGVLQSEDGVLFTSLGINSSTIDFESLNNFVSEELGNSLHIVGGILQSYDGSTINETGFALYPENLSTSVASGSVPVGIYNYVAVYAWIDNNGQLHRSAPSLLLQENITSSAKDVTLTIPTLRHTKKENVFIEVYRTENAGTIYYKITSNTNLLLNDKTVDSVTFVDDNLDSAILTGEILYTTGGTLDNIAPPSTNVIGQFKNRLVVKSADEENVLWYSKIRQEAYPVEFSDFLRIVVDSKGGDITALGTLDDKLIIFKQSRVFMQAGDGPNNLGQQSDFGLPQLITSDAGCVDVNSVVETPVGLMFKSSKGIYLLNRGLGLQYIGAEVELYNSSRITSAVLVPDSNQVRFTTEDNLALVYDYFYQQWYTFTNHEAAGAATYKFKYAFVKDDGRVFLENTSKFTDGAQAVKLKLVTSWLQLADLQGFQRVYKMLILGEYLSPHRLRVRLGYDFNSVFTQETIIDTDDILNPTAYGDSSPYGEEEVYGGDYPLYQWRIFPTIQKCQSIRVSIEDILDSDFGASFTISGLRLEIGSKQGSNKLESAKSHQTS